jgi:hypothetical protein
MSLPTVINERLAMAAWASGGLLATDKEYSDDWQNKEGGRQQSLNPVVRQEGRDVGKKTVQSEHQAPHHEHLRGNMRLK